MPTHFPNGVSNQVKGNPLFNYPYMDPFKYYMYHDDFFEFHSGIYTITTTEAGTGSATEVITAGAGGQLLITNAAGDNDLDFLQLKGESFLWDSTKRMFFTSRFKTNDATQSEIIMGLQITDTTPLDITDGIYFFKPDGDTQPDFVVEKDNDFGTSVLEMNAMADDTFVTLSFEYDPLDVATGGPVFRAYQDGAKVGQIASTVNAPDDEELTISFGIQNGEAVVKTLSLDFLMAAVER
jgi:hypothetical protein|tara:strand:- start:3948 stop:4661 length:714 start_codon:yes stop_codon:yes gene_type:complete